MSRYPGAGDGSAPMGSMIVEGPTGPVRVSARLASRALTAATSDTAGLAALLGTTAGGRRKKQRGGAVDLEAVKAFAGRAAAWASSTFVAPVVPKVGMAFGETAMAGQTAMDTSVKLVILAIGLYRAVIGVSSRIVGNLGRAADSAEALLTSGAAQSVVADKISSEAPTAIAVAVLALTQAGIISLTTVVALVLRALGTGLTGSGRAAATVAFYVWYVQRGPDEQARIKAAANEAVTEIRAGAADGGPKVAALASAIAGGVASAIAKVRGAAPLAPAPEAAVQAAAVELGAAGPAAVEAEAGAAAVVLVAAVNQPEVQVVAGAAGPAAVVVEALAGAEVAAEAPAPRPSRKRKSREGEEVGDGGLGEGAPTQGLAKVVKSAPVLPGEQAPPGGRRKTKKTKAKRRVTRRRKVTKVLGAPVFVY